MFRSPLNKVFLKLDQKYIRNISSLVKEAHIQNLSSVDPADYVNIMGTVISTPMEISKDKRDYLGYSTDDIKPGDTAIFSSSVVAERYMPGPDSDPIFKNSFWYKNAEYWMCDIQELYAVIRDGKIRMQNGFVMLENLEAQPLLYLPQHLKKTMATARGIVSHIGKNLEGRQRIKADVGDAVFFNPNHLRIYQINGKPFGIVTQQQVLGHEIPSYGEYADLVTG